MPLNQRFHVVLWCFSSERHFSPLTAKASPNPITTRNIANLQNAIRRIHIITFSWLWGPYHQSKMLYEASK